MDVVGAYLLGDLDEEVYMKAPRGYTRQALVLRLLKGLYGLK